MTKIRDPRIVGPHSDADKMAVEQLQVEQAIRQNPLYGVVKQLEERVVHMGAQWRTANIRYQATMDYLAHVGILLHQDIDDDGQVVGAPYAPNMAFFEKLVEKGILDSMPEYGFTAYYIEHNERTIFLIEMMTQLQKSIADMDKVLDMVRDFNALPNRIVPILGAEIGLDGYLTANPDNWTDEKCDSIALEFGLVKGADNEETSKEEKTTGEVVPFDRNVGESEDDEGTVS